VAIELLLLLLQETLHPCSTILWAYHCAGLQLQCWQWHHCSAGEGQSTASACNVCTSWRALFSPPIQLISLAHAAQLCSVHPFSWYRLHRLHSFVQSTLSADIACTCCTALFIPPIQLISLVHIAQLCSVHHFSYRLYILHSFVQSTISADIACTSYTALFSPPFQLISLVHPAQLCSVHHFSWYCLHMLHSFVQSTISADIVCTCCTALFSPPFQLILLAHAAQLCSEIPVIFFFILLLYLLLPFLHAYSSSVFLLPSFLLLPLSPSPSFSSPPSFSLTSTPASHFFSFHFFYSYSYLILFLQSEIFSIVDGYQHFWSWKHHVASVTNCLTSHTTKHILNFYNRENLNPIQSITQLLKFWKNLLPPSSGKNWNQLLLLSQLCFICSGSRYGCDLTAMSCSLQWSLNTDLSSFVYNICLLILGGILPAALMYVQLRNNNLQGSKFV